MLTLLDLELSGYTLVTYRASKLHPEVLAAHQAIIVTRESEPSEVAALVGLCGGCEAMSPDEWSHLLGNLALGESVVLPITEEAHGKARRIRLAPRLTPHVRHLAKYINIPVPQRRAFLFAPDGAPTAGRHPAERRFPGTLGGAGDRDQAFRWHGRERDAIRSRPLSPHSVCGRNRAVLGRWRSKARPANLPHRARA